MAKLVEFNGHAEIEAFKEALIELMNRTHGHDCYKVTLWIDDGLKFKVNNYTWSAPIGKVVET